MLGHNFIRKKFGNYLVFIAQAFEDSIIENAISRGLASLHTSFPLHKVPSSKNASVYKFECLVNDQPCVFYFKAFHYRSVWDFLKHLFRSSRARRALFAAGMLECNGLATPAVIAVGEKRRLGICLSSFLLTAETPAAQPFDVYFREAFAYSNPDASQSAKREFIQEFGHFVGRLHAANIAHGDLRVGNVLVTQMKKVHAFALLDNERTVQYSNIPLRLRVKNLVQVNLLLSPAITNTDRMRFFTCYLYENSSIEDPKALAHEVIKATNRRLQKPKLRSRLEKAYCCSLPN